MEAIIERCCGLDVHQASVMACLLVGPVTGRPKREVRRFGTFLKDLLELRAWLEQNQCTHVAMEITGVYWRPVYAVLEDGFELVVGNAFHMKNVPGRKTDVKDSEWIADLMRHGLIAKSFVPPEDIRECRAKKSYFRDKYYRLKARRGHKRARMAIAHKILIAVYHVLFERQPYAELGAAYLDQRRSERARKQLIGRLEGLGFNVILQPKITSRVDENDEETAD